MGALDCLSGMALPLGADASKPCVVWGKAYVSDPFGDKTARDMLAFGGNWHAMLCYHQDQAIGKVTKKSGARMVIFLGVLGLINDYKKIFF